MRRTLTATIEVTVESERSLFGDCTVLSQVLTRALSNHLQLDQAHGWRSDNPQLLINEFEVGSIVQKAQT